MKRRWLAIVNPAAGGMNYRLNKRALLRELSSLVDQLVFTEAPGGAVDLAKGAAGYDGLVCVGGDGTVAEVLNGMDHDCQILAIIPAGTGNCLALDLGLDTIQDALQVIDLAQGKRIDLMQATLRFADGGKLERWVGSTFGMGYSCDVAGLAKRRFSSLGGFAYAAAALAARPQWHSLRFHFDEEPWSTMRLTGIVVNNTRHIGRVRVFPKARLTDGKLDVFVFQSGWLRQNLHVLQLLTEIPLPGTPRPRQAWRVALHFQTPTRVTLDGEVVEAVVNLEIVCWPLAVECLVAKSGLWSN